MNTRRGFARAAAFVAIAALGAVWFPACGAHETGGEDVGEAQQAEGEGCFTTSACPAGNTCCKPSPFSGGYCRNLQTDESNCGSCFNDCCPGGGFCFFQCTSGHCCSIGTEWCNNACRNLQTDVNNCGSCGHACSFANASASCVNGQCVMGACNAGFANCDGNSANGCEVNLNSDVNNCGSCGNTCPGGSCSLGHCCPSGHTWCANQGECTDFTSADMCGSCFRDCTQCATNCQGAGGVGPAVANSPDNRCGCHPNCGAPACQ
jgi:hypothetical protein